MSLCHDFASLSSQFVTPCSCSFSLCCCLVCLCSFFVSLAGLFATDALLCVLCPFCRCMYLFVVVQRVFVVFCFIVVVLLLVLHFLCLFADVCVFFGHVVSPCSFMSVFVVICNSLQLFLSL